YSGGFNQHTMVRNNWTQGGNTILSTYCPNTLIDHEAQICGRFDVVANNEYITKGRVVFNDYNEVMAGSTQSNLASIANTVSTACATLSDGCGMWYYQFLFGGQVSHGQQPGLNSIQHSELPAYVADIFNSTND